MRITAAAVAACAVLVLAGCGSSTTTTVAPLSGSGTTTSQSSTSTPTQASSSSSASTAVAGPSPCRGSVLALSLLGQQGATGHGLLGFALRNTGSSSCHTFGYPGILWLTKSGTPLPTDPVRTTHDFFGSAPLVSLVLAPGNSVSFRLGVTHGIDSTNGCSTAYGLQVIPPNDTATLRVAIPNGAFECRTTTVSPVRPGTSAFH